MTAFRSIAFRNELTALSTINSAVVALRMLVVSAQWSFYVSTQLQVASLLAFDTIEIRI
jgi:hypothetical protein